MANFVSNFSYLNRRELGFIPAVKSHYFNNCIEYGKILHCKDLFYKCSCLFAIEFSSDGEFLISGGNDGKVTLWRVAKTIQGNVKPMFMRSSHERSIFCLGITADTKDIYSGGNDCMVIIHNTETKTPVDVLQHHRAVCGLSIDPFTNRAVATAGNDGRLLLFDTRHSLHESMVIACSYKPFQSVMFHPQQTGVVLSSNIGSGVALWDLRSIKCPLIRYSTIGGSHEYYSLNARFNTSGSHIVTLGHRQTPLLYNTTVPEPIMDHYHPDYYNSRALRSCCFGGEGDQLIMSGSDDYNIYLWKMPKKNDYVEDNRTCLSVCVPQMVVSGHISFVNHVRYNSRYCVMASSGVENVIKLWSPGEFMPSRGLLFGEGRDPSTRNPRFPLSPLTPRQPNDSSDEEQYEVPYRQYMDAFADPSMMFPIPRNRYFAEGPMQYYHGMTRRGSMVSGLRHRYRQPRRGPHRYFWQRRTGDISGRSVVRRVPCVNRRLPDFYDEFRRPRYNDYLRLYEFFRDRQRIMSRRFDSRRSSSLGHRQNQSWVSTASTESSESNDEAENRPGTADGDNESRRRRASTAQELIISYYEDNPQPRTNSRYSGHPLPELMRIYNGDSDSGEDVIEPPRRRSPRLQDQIFNYYEDNPLPSTSAGYSGHLLPGQFRVDDHVSDFSDEEDNNMYLEMVVEPVYTDSTAQELIDSYLNDLTNSRGTQGHRSQAPEGFTWLRNDYDDMHE